jgi:2-succinyl-6-hydroxy-2,4-cyclohexadiene-1-carboxylate synthase
MARVTLIHGFTQTGRSWSGITEALLDAEHEVLTPDCPGHGTRSGVHVGLADGALVIGEECGRGVYVGYSMGGRYALHLALARPDLVDKLVLIGANPGIEDPVDREDRRQVELTQAKRLRHEGLEAFLEWWLAGPLFTSLSREAAGLEARKENSVRGLASSLRLAGVGSQQPLWDHLSALRMPVLYVFGGHDDKFRAIGERVAQSVGTNARLAMISGAGHACHLEKPTSFLAELLSFIGPAR